VLLRQVELALLLKTHASVMPAQGPELGPFLGELLGETALRRNGPGPSGLLVLRAGRRRGNLTPLERLMEAVELRKSEFAVAVVLGACGLRLQVCVRVGSSAAACAGRRRGLGCCRLICAVVVYITRADVCYSSDALAGREGGHPRWLWILEVVARQPDLLSRAGNGAQEGNKPVIGCV
jgi:hypothetical protein